MSKRILSLILIISFSLSLFSCAAPFGKNDGSAVYGTKDGPVSVINDQKFLRESVKVETPPDPEVKINPNGSLDIPTQVTKIGDTWFIVDCYHNRIIYNDDLKKPLTEWLVLTDEMDRGHTIASDGTVYLADDTENERVMIFEKKDGRFLFTQEFSDITSRPHYIVYDERTKTFYCWCSMSGEMYLFVRPENDTNVYLKEIRSIPELNGVYVRSFTILGDEILFVSGNKKILRADLETFKILSEYPVPPSMAGMIQITKIEDMFYITISTDENWNQDAATIIRCHSLEDLIRGDFEDVYESFIGGGTPYYITEIDGAYYMTEHRLPGHSVWRFTVDNGRINAETIY